VSVERRKQAAVNVPGEDEKDHQYKFEKDLEVFTLVKCLTHEGGNTAEFFQFS
jgi:hypothetical protein